MNNNLYKVVFERILKHCNDIIKEVEIIHINVFASSVIQAIEKAWETVTISASDYEITSVCKRNSINYPRGYYRDD